MEEETEREQEAARALMLERLREALATLTPRQASCLYARFWEGKPFKEIAEAEGFSTSAATVTVRNALIKLRKYFIKRGWMEPPKEDAICQDNTAQAEQKKDEREKVLKEIRQLENRQKIFAEQAAQRGTQGPHPPPDRARGHFGGRFPAGPRLIWRGSQDVPCGPLPPAGSRKTGRRTAEVRGQAVSPLLARAHLCTVAGAVRVVAKSACLRFRLAAKTAPAPCSSFPHENRSAGFSRGPMKGCCALRARWGATLPKPLVRHRLRNSRKRLSRPLRPDLSHPKGGVTYGFCHATVSIIQRSKGRSAVAAAAYRSGTKLTNEWDSLTHDYTHKTGVVHSEIMLPTHAPPEFADRSTLWNSVEQIEKARDSQLAREVEAALPAN